MKYRHIVWDWNGTLLNDGHASADAVDKMLKRRNLGELSYQDYQERITFPVIKLYYESGFDFINETYEDMCDEFILNYKANKPMITLQRDVHEVLGCLKKKGARQHIVSASEYRILVQQIEEYGLFEYFDIILGQMDHKAESKLHLATRLIQETQCNPHEVLFIGDTIHDFEVARDAGFDCFLVSNGHCSRNRLHQTNAPVYTSLRDLVETIEVF